MSRRALLALAALAACLVAAVPALARSKAPVVKSVQPLKAKIGDTLVIRGANFVRGRNRNTVVFMGAGKRVVWVKAYTATSSRLKVKLTPKLATLLDQRNGALIATRLRLRVISRRSGRSFTRTGMSPVISPYSTGSGGTGGGSGTTSGPTSGPTGSSSCSPSSYDNDGLPADLELAIGTDPCNPDTDGDGVSDGYEYQSALDYNRNAGTSQIPWPYPGTRPFPNPLDGSDAGRDHDGDDLTLRDEYDAWKAYGSQIAANDGVNLLVLNYSDGDQTTGPPAADQAFTSLLGYQDMDGNGWITDDEKDVDGDGLTNWDELRGRATQAWWKAWSQHNGEKEYDKVLIFPALDWLNPDSNGDGVPDGADDQDSDGYTNAQEQSRDWAQWYFTGVGAYVWQPGPDMGTNNGPKITIPPVGAITDDAHAFVNPFNPCLPDPTSPSCTRHPPFEDPPSPFSGKPSDAGLHGYPEQIHWPVAWG